MTNILAILDRINCRGNGVKTWKDFGMHALIVHCHPEPASFNAALTKVSKATLGQRGFSVEVSDLYREGFDPREHSDHYRKSRERQRFLSPG